MKPADLLRELGVKAGRDDTMSQLAFTLAREVIDLRRRLDALEHPKRTRAKQIISRLAGALASE